MSERFAVFLYTALTLLKSVQFAWDTPSLLALRCIRNHRSDDSGFDVALAAGEAGTADLLERGPKIEVRIVGKSMTRHAGWLGG